MSSQGNVRQNTEVSGGDEHKQYAVQRYIMGDIQVLNDWLDDKPWVVQFPNWLLRAIGAPIFLNNPISGAIILIGMFVNDPWVAVNALLGLCAAIITAVLLRQGKGDIASGGVTFHGMLVGIVISSSIDKDSWYPWTIFPVILMGILSVYVASGLGQVFGRLGIPAFNLPFVVCTWLFLGAVQYPGVNAHFPIRPSPPLLENETLPEADIDWAKMFQPLLLAEAQIYGSTNLVVGGLVVFAMMIASPIIFLHATVGSLVSIFTALALAAPPKEIYDGTWSFNAMLCCSSLGGFFWVLTPQSHVLAIFSAVFSTIAYGGLSTAFRPAGLPALAFPFVFTASLFLALTSESKALRRVPLSSLSYPEKHRKLFNVAAVGENGLNPV